MEHRPSPDDGLVAGVKQPDGHGLHAVIDGRDYHLAAHIRHVFAAHHNRHVRAVNVGVEDAHFRAHHSERHGQIDRDRRFTHAAFAGADRDDVFDAGDLCLVDRAARLRHFRLHLDFDAFDAGHGHDGLLGLEFELITPPQTFTSRIMLSATMSLCRSGSLTARSALRITSSVIWVVSEVCWLIFFHTAFFIWMNSHRRPQRTQRSSDTSVACGALRWLTVFIHLKTDIFHMPYFMFHTA